MKQTEREHIPIDYLYLRPEYAGKLSVLGCRGPGATLENPGGRGRAAEVPPRGAGRQ